MTRFLLSEPAPDIDVKATARRILSITTASLGLACTPVLAQTSPAHGPLLAAPGAPAAPADSASLDVPMADYLALLAQIAPAAHDGAQTYLSAVRQRCSRSLTTLELRRAMSDGAGDPVLMAMIRASHLRDRRALEASSLQVVCPSGGRQ